MPRPPELAPAGSAVLLVAVLLLAGGCLDPAGRRPGFRLTGEEAQPAGGDLRFARDVELFALETRTWYRIPHSVTVTGVLHGDSLYIPSRSPRTKRWVAHVLRDPRVRLRVGDRILRGRLVRVEDPHFARQLEAAFARKYGRPIRPVQGGLAPEVWFFRFAPELRRP